MTQNRELFVRDPVTSTIPNEGVAKVKAVETEAERDTLRWELETFVCEGEFEAGLERILSSFLRHLDKNEQPSVWVSGFYGSGKSHLLKILDHLWRNPPVGENSRARDVADLPTAITDLLTELSTEGRRRGGLWSAAGTLGAGMADSLRLAFLSVIYDSAGLPQQYGRARLELWLRAEGHLDAVRAHLADHGRDFDHELANMYVSPPLHRALVETIPDFAASPGEVSSMLQAQYPSSPDLTNQDVLDAFREVLEFRADSDGKVPLTLVVLDEMQQYIGEDIDRALAVQDLVEAASSEFHSQVLFVASGQSAMTQGATIGKLNDRFSLKVALSDADVEAVIRRVILQKKPSKQAALQSTLDAASGEISRHLGGTKIAATGQDRDDLTMDYPLLPTRRRFWERALRTIDRAQAGVLRSQLRIVHEASKQVATEDIGHVVGADFIYDQKNSDMLNGGVLQRSVDELIRGLRDGTTDGELKSRLCALVFLISKLPQDGFGDTGLRATPNFLADLLVEDLSGGAQVRERVPQLLRQLEDAGALLRVDDRYQLETEEGAEWRKDFDRRRVSIRGDAVRMTSLRNEQLRQLVDNHVVSVRLVQGRSKTPRKVEAAWGQELPGSDSGAVPVWIRDGWNVTESQAHGRASEAGTDDAVVHVFLPKLDDSAIREALAAAAAARDTVSQNSVPQTDDGRSARQAMETRAESEEEKLSDLFADVADAAIVWQGGGHTVDGDTMKRRVESAAEASLVRLYPKFSVGDHPGWSSVLDKTRQSSAPSLDQVGYDGDALGHPVCKQVFGAISAAGVQGRDVIAQFQAPPFGWPLDTIRGAIMTLYAAGYIRAEDNNKPYDGPSSLPATQVNSARLIKEDPPPTIEERLAVKKLLMEATITDYPSNHEQRVVGSLLQKLVDLAERAGGAPPLPPEPNLDHVRAFRGRSGNDQFRAVAEAKDTLLDDLQSWEQAANERVARERRWSELDRLLVHASDLPQAEEIRQEREAIYDERLLLADPDPVTPLLQQVTQMLRSHLQTTAQQAVDEHDRLLQELTASPEWDELDDDRWRSIIQRVGFQRPSVPEPSSDAELLAELDRANLKRWREQVELLRSRAEQARKAAVEACRGGGVSGCAAHRDPEAHRC